jgi:hypothetical protein
MSDRQILDWIRKENDELKSSISMADTEIYRVKSENERLKSELAQLRGETPPQPKYIPYSHSETMFGTRPDLTDTAVRTSVTGDTQRQMVRGNENFNINTFGNVRGSNNRINQHVYGDSMPKFGSHLGYGNDQDYSFKN